MGPREDIWMMFQQATLFPWRTVMENVVLPIEIRDGKKAARAAHGRARELLSMAGLERFDHAYPNELSGGMAQRAAIRSEEHTSELQSLMRISYAVFCLKKKRKKTTKTKNK